MSKFHIWIIQTSAAVKLAAPYKCMASFTLWLNDVMSQIFMTWLSFTWTELTLAGALKIKPIFTVIQIIQAKDQIADEF